MILPFDNHRKRPEVNRQSCACRVMTFDHHFDGSDMSPDEILLEAGKRGWPGLRIDGDDYFRTGRTIVYRMTRRQVDEE